MLIYTTMAVVCVGYVHYRALVLSGKALRQSLATVVKSMQCCIEKCYLDGLDYFCNLQCALHH